MMANAKQDIFMGNYHTAHIFKLDRFLIFWKPILPYQLSALSVMKTFTYHQRHRRTLAVQKKKKKKELLGPHDRSHQNVLENRLLFISRHLPWTATWLGGIFEATGHGNLYRVSLIV